MPALIDDAFLTRIRRAVRFVEGMYERPLVQPERRVVVPGPAYWFWFAHHYSGLDVNITAQMHPGFGGEPIGLAVDYYDMQKSVVLGLRVQLAYLPHPAGTVTVQVGKYTAGAYVWEAKTLILAAGQYSARRTDLALRISEGDRLAMRTICDAAYFPSPDFAQFIAAAWVRTGTGFGP